MARFFFQTPPTVTKTLTELRPGTDVPIERKITFYALGTVELIKFRAVAGLIASAYSDITSLSSVQKSKREKLKTAQGTQETVEIEPAELGTLVAVLDRKKAAIVTVFEKLLADERFEEICLMVATTMRDEAKTDEDRKALAKELMTLPPDQLLFFMGGALEACGHNFAPFLKALVQQVFASVATSSGTGESEDPEEGGEIIPGPGASGRTTSSGPRSNEESSAP